MVANVQNEKKMVVLSRDVMAMMVPSGARIMLHQGTEVTITQALGNSYTLVVYGNMARLDGKDADAIGFEPVDVLASLPPGASIDDKVSAQLHMVFDPEIPVNIMDLGLVYRCDIEKQSNDQYVVTIDMTLTAPGCGMGPVIAQDAQDKVMAIPEVELARVNIVFDPPWDQGMMSDVAKLELGML